MFHRKIVSSILSNVSNVSNVSKKPYPVYRMGYNPDIVEQKYKEKVICVKDYSNIYYKFVKISYTN
jgi:hypothetical protein